MSVQATYDLHVDWARNGNFSDAGDDISADFRRAEVDQGFADPLARFGMTGRASFLVKNVDKDYSPPLDGDVLPYRPIRFRMTYSGTTRTLFRGFIENIRPTAGIFGPRSAVVDCVDATALLDLFQGRISIQVGAYADEIISAVVSDVYTPPSTDYDDGRNLFPTSGDRWALPTVAASRRRAREGAAEEIQASQKIMDICASDWGRFYIAGDGAPTFRNRHHMPLMNTTSLTLNDDMAGLSYEKPVRVVYNLITVTYLPRTVGETNEVLGQFAPERKVHIKPLETQVHTIRFRDPANQEIRIGGLSVVTPVEGTDWEATDDEAGEGADVSANLTVNFTAYADHAEVEIENTHSSDDAFIQFFRVRGRAVRTREPETVTARNDVSIDDYGQRRLPISATLISSSAEAKSLADYLLSVYKDPVDVITAVEIIGNRSATMMAAVRDLELMDKVNITESQTGLSSFEGHIYHLRHVINSQFEHRLLFALEQPYDVGGDPFFLGDALDSGHILIY